MTLYTTGGGRLSTEALPRLTLSVKVTVNDQPAEVLYAGIAPTLPEGANQVNIRLSAAVTSGSLSIVLTVGTMSSRAFVFVP